MANVVAGLLVLHPMQTTPVDSGPMFAMSAPAQPSPAPQAVAIPIIGLGSPAVAILETPTAEPEASGAHSEASVKDRGESQSLSKASSENDTVKSRKDESHRMKSPEQPVDDGSMQSTGVIARG